MPPTSRADITGVCVCLCVCMSVCVCLCVCMSVCVSVCVYRIHTYFRGVQTFAIFANEPQTTKINTCENLSCHCFATCIRPTAISWTSKAIKNIVTLILMRAATQCALNRKIANLTVTAKMKTRENIS